MHSFCNSTAGAAAHLGKEAGEASAQAAGPTEEAWSLAGALTWACLAGRMRAAAGACAQVAAACQLAQGEAPPCRSSAAAAAAEPVQPACIILPHHHQYYQAAIGSVIIAVRWTCCCTWE